MGSTARVLAIATIIGLLCGSLTGGCAGKAIRYVDSGRSYDATAALDVLAQTDSSAVAKESASNTTRLRTRALAELTRTGTAGSKAASLLTSTFPSNAGGVPLYVERVTFNGKPSVLVVEAAGRAGGTLDSKRLWVIGDDGEVLFAGTR